MISASAWRAAWGILPPPPIQGEKMKAEEAPGFVANQTRFRLSPNKQCALDVRADSPQPSWGSQEGEGRMDRKQWDPLEMAVAGSGLF